MNQLSVINTALSMLYTDRMDIQRYTKGKDVDGNSETVLHPVPEVTGVPCRISFSTPDSPVKAADGNPTDIQPKLFCAADVPLKSGDFVTVLRDGSVLFSGNIGRPTPYRSHQEALFQDKGVS